MTTQQTHYSLSNTVLLEGLRAHLQPLAGDARQYDGLLALIGRARFALLGEASHGTHEFYRERAEITKRLITEKGFTAVAVEADWPDAWRVNRYVRGLSDDTDADAALSGFQRFPAWMWRNTVVRDFVEWLRDYNTGLSPLRQVGFYGLDLYSLFTSIQAVLTYLDEVDPQAARRARYRYACFDHAAEDSQAYGYAASFGLKGSCEDEVVLLALPLGVSVLPSILLAGCPNRKPDQAAAKRTLVVILGKRGAVRLAMAATFAAPAIAALLALAREDMAELLGWSAAGGAVHAVWLLRRLRQFTAGEMPERIDGVIVLALTFILWFCVPPLMILKLGYGP